jgi:hypothetical protein
VIGDERALRTAAEAAEAWLDVLLLTTMIALAPCEWSARFVIAWTRAFGDGS